MRIKLQALTEHIHGFLLILHFSPVLFFLLVTYSTFFTVFFC